MTVVFQSVPKMHPEVMILEPNFHQILHFDLCTLTVMRHD